MTSPDSPSPRTEAVRERIGAVIDRWYHLGLIRFSSRDDGSDDLILRDELTREAEAAQEAPAPEGLRAALRAIECVDEDRAEARPPEGLTEAWAAAEAATDQKMLSVERLGTGTYGAEGWLHYPSKRVRETGPTPAAALLALAARLSAGGAG